MSISRGRHGHGRDSPRTSLERRGTRRKVTTGQKKFLRKLFYTLAEIIDEKHQRTDDQEPDWSEDEGDLETKKDDNMDREKMLLMRFERFYESYNDLVIPTQHSLHVLGGGNMAAQCVEELRDVLKSLLDLCFAKATFTVECVDSLEDCTHVIREMKKAFKDLDILTTDFLRQLEKIEVHLKVLVTKLEGEYGLPLSRGRDENIDWSLEILTSSFEALIPQLKDVVQKELPAVRETQDFSTQRYLMVSTISTFLSSVTATTLQISSGGSISALTTTINTIWLISLVYSATAAIYSLIYMIWRQSPVRPPSAALPKIVHELLKSGPTYLLFGALVTFLLGLCLLTFQLGLQQGRLGSAAIPFMYGTVFTLGTVAFFGLLILEQFNSGLIMADLEPDDQSDTSSQSGESENEESQTKSDHDSKNVTSGLLPLMRRLLVVITRKGNSRTASADEYSIVDLEHGTDAIDAPPTPFAPSLSRLDESTCEGVNQFSDPPGLAKLDHPTAGLLGMSARLENNPLATQLPIGNADDTAASDYRPFKDLLQFSPDGCHLAYGISDAVVIYDASNSFVVAHTIGLPDADLVKQIAWSPDGKLLVRTSRKVLVYAPNNSGCPDVLVGRLDQAVGPIRCVGPDTQMKGTRRQSDIDDYEEVGSYPLQGFSCPINTMVKVFDHSCKELQSYDLSGLRRSGIKRIVRILDAMLSEHHIIYLANVQHTDGVPGTHCFVAELDLKRVESHLRVPIHCTSFLVCRFDGTVFFHGNEPGVHVKEEFFWNPEYSDPLIKELYKLSDKTWDDCKLSRPEKATLLYGPNDGLILQVSDREIAVITNLHEREYSSIHIFDIAQTLAARDAIPTDPISFAVAPPNANDKDPYLFALGCEDGSITLWSVQSNKRLADIEKAKELEVLDYRLGRFKSPVVTTGRFMVLPRPSDSSDST